MKYTIIKTETINELRILVNEIDEVCNQPYSAEGCITIDNNELRIREIIRELIK